jgi:hypothetical protein
MLFEVAPYRKTEIPRRACATPVPPPLDDEF